MTAINLRTANDLSTATTVVDAAVEFLRGRRKTGALLLGAAALSRKIPGLGTAASILLRVYRWMR